MVKYGLDFFIYKNKKYMKKYGRHYIWTEYEIDYLKNNTNKTASDISKEINRSKLAIQSKCRKLNINLKVVFKCKGIAGTPEKEIERRKKISISMKKNPKSGGLRRGSGRGKKGWYKGYWCDSSWELAWVIYQLDNDKKIERNWNKFDYFYENKKHYYIPDFLMDNKYYEIKGYMTEKNKEKIINQNIKKQIFALVVTKNIKKVINVYYVITYHKGKSKDHLIVNY